MLELKEITKVYPVASGDVSALKGISLKFRKSEFVSILGPSGCGKTTMLNIIGGLDKYTSGELLIGGRKTASFSDREWDAYRNHSVGFVFQNYNLIPHQSVLQNVELALSLSGVSKKQRKEKAQSALAKVGLAEQMNKKPSELSGGQMQRVAIARAIVNDPEIILADEPTGALDTETSIQVMEILKEISNDRLVIMVTHNPDLANEYSTRIIKMLDGRIKGDSMPYEDEIKPTQEKVKGRKKLPSMSFLTSFSLSLKNLFTKKGRTALTAFAGSIGIIGIALIFAVSHGMTNYINTVEEETLSAYPLMIESTHIGIGQLLSTFMEKARSDVDHELDAVYQKEMVYELINSLNSIEEDQNDLKSFKKFIDDSLAGKTDEDRLSKVLSGVSYTYDLDINIYTENDSGKVYRSDSEELLSELLAGYMGMTFDSGSASSGGSSAFMSMAQQGGNSQSLWQELLPGKNGEPVNELVTDQYDIVYGAWPQNFNELVIVLDKNNEIDNFSLYALGLIPREEIEDIMNAAKDGSEIKISDKSWSYEDICGVSLRAVLNSDCFIENEVSGGYEDLRDTDAGMKYLYDNVTDLKVVGIIRPKNGALAEMLGGKICYTSALTEYVIDKSHESDAAKAQMDNKNTDILTGLPFKNSSDVTESEKAEEFKTYVSEMGTAAKSALYYKIMSLPSDEYLESAVNAAMADMDRAKMEQMMKTALKEQMNLSEDKIDSYLASITDENLEKMYKDALVSRIEMQYASEAAKQLAVIPPETLPALLDKAIAEADEASLAKYYDKTMEFSSSTYEDNLKKFGCVDIETPSLVNLYASSFENKDILKEIIEDYNEKADELAQINYTDYVGIMISSITTIIDAITYILIAFVAISLIVSSIMIGVITLISVQERTKEIGILRAIGASKRNVSSMFNAETVIIGFISGALGVGVTYLLTIPLNAILRSLTNIQNLKAVLPIEVAAALVVISVLLTLISGIIPSRSAAKKDPVVALRTE